MIIAAAYIALGFIMASAMSVFPIRDEEPNIEFVGDSATFLAVATAWPLFAAYITGECILCLGRRFCMWFATGIGDRMVSATERYIQTLKKLRSRQ